MSATMKSGLIFGLAGMIAVFAISWVPYLIGGCLCGPTGALIFGGVAGYFALKWNEQQVGIGQGVLAGTVAGVGALIGGLAFWLAAVAFRLNTPEGMDYMRMMIESQPETAQLSDAELQGILGVMGPMIGLCFGVLNLLLALLGGMFGAMFAGKKAVNTSGGYPPAPPTTPSM